MQKWFITGTDTDVGKTYVGQQLMLGLAEQGYKTLGYKPISAGCEWIKDELCNDDAMQYQKNSTLTVSLKEVNPIAYEPPIAPHIAAAQQGEALEIRAIEQGFQNLVEYKPDVIITEGAGGWRLPLGDNRYFSVFPVEQKMKVILVVGLKLGCLNHAILTAETIKRDGAHLAGWIANHIDTDMLLQQQNIDALTAELGPPLGVVPALNALSTKARSKMVDNLIRA